MNKRVKWLPWNEESFKKARDDKRPVLLAISATWCHWCHVMDDSTYSDESVIDAINNRFVPIRIDNDKRPDINRRYNMGGWPSVAFLTPSKQVITGTTYEPPETLLKLLNDVSDYYRLNTDTLIRYDASKKLREPATESDIPANAVDIFIKQSKNDFDDIHGGFGFQPKFPFIDTLGFLLEIGHQKRDGELLNMVVTTLANMANGDIFDNISGGFFRYATRNDWSVPHYEKMLEDNSKLLKLYLEAYQVTEQASLLSSAIHIFDYLNSTLRGESGFYGSQDADEKYYLADAGVRAQLKPPGIDKTVFTDWNALAISSFLLFSVLAKSKEASSLAIQILDKVYHATFSSKVGFIHYEDKSGPAITGLLEDNALMIGALIDAYEESGDENYLERASATGKLLMEVLWDNESKVFIDRVESYSDASPSIVDNSITALALIRLGRLLDDPAMIDHSRLSLTYFRQDYGEYGIIAASYGVAVKTLTEHPIDISFIGESHEIDPLLKEIRQEYLPGRIIRRGRLAKEKIESEESGAYVCVGKKCLAPAKSIDQLLKTIENAKISSA